MVPKRTIILALAVLLHMAPLTGFAGERIALVIGNSDYRHAPYLPNAARDARDVARTLREIGFDVHDGYDLGRIDTLRLVHEVTAKLVPEDVALLYFSGHGIQIGSVNYVLPVDAQGEDEAALKEASVSLQAILREMDLRSERSIVILDACRNNPFQTRMVSRSVGGPSRGLARVDAGVGSYIAFSTQPGNVALDGQGRNSPFTEALLRHLPARSDDLHELMRKVRADVVAATDGAQVPWENSSLIERIYLSEPAGRPAAPAAAEPAPAPAPQPQPAGLPPFTHVVAGLDPDGDGFLALRAGTTSGAQRLAKMTEGTRLAVLDQNGVWFHVRTDSGLTGWAHSNWIRFVGAAAIVPAPQPMQPAAETGCDALWTRRNAIFARHGYCFQSARGKAAFSNEGCIPGMSAEAAPLTAAERAEVSRIIALERSSGC